VKRKPISASTRWQIFARDGFRCRYCGIQAGDDGVTLHLDHVVSVADGGTNAFDNLVTACQRCNGGKSARSLDEVPGSASVIAYAQADAASMREQVEVMAACIDAKRDLEVAVYDMLCEIYGENKVSLSEASLSLYVTFVRQYGAEQVMEWAEWAARRGLSCWSSIQYVCGCARKRREQSSA
jgi:hypothetical protein